MSGKLAFFARCTEKGHFTTQLYSHRKLNFRRTHDKRVYCVRKGRKMSNFSRERRVRHKPQARTAFCPKLKSPSRSSHSAYTIFLSLLLIFITAIILISNTTAMTPQYLFVLTVHVCHLLILNYLVEKCYWISITFNIYLILI